MSFVLARRCRFDANLAVRLFYSKLSLPLTRAPFSSLSIPLPVCSSSYIFKFSSFSKALGNFALCLIFKVVHYNPGHYNCHWDSTFAFLEEDSEQTETTGSENQPLSGDGEPVFKCCSFKKNATRPRKMRTEKEQMCEFCRSVSKSTLHERFCLYHNLLK